MAENGRSGEVSCLPIYGRTKCVLLGLDRNAMYAACQAIRADWCGAPGGPRPGSHDVMTRSVHPVPRKPRTSVRGGSGVHPAGWLPEATGVSPWYGVHGNETGSC